MLYKTFKSIRLFAILAGLMLTLAACGGNAPAATAVPATTDPGTTTTTDATPATSESAGGGSADAETAAKEYLDAIFGLGDKTPSDFLCSTVSDEVKASQKSLEDGMAAFSASGATIDTSGLTFTSETQGDRVIVTVNGSASVEMAGTKTDMPMTDVKFSLVKEGDEWKAC